LSREHGRRRGLIEPSPPPYSGSIASAASASSLRTFPITRFALAGPNMRPPPHTCAPLHISSRQHCVGATTIPARFLNAAGALATLTAPTRSLLPSGAAYTTCYAHTHVLATRITLEAAYYGLVFKTAAHSYSVPRLTPQLLQRISRVPLFADARIAAPRTLARLSSLRC